MSGRRRGGRSGPREYVASRRADHREDTKHWFLAHRVVCVPHHRAAALEHRVGVVKDVTGGVELFLIEHLPALRHRHRHLFHEELRELSAGELLVHRQEDVVLLGRALAALRVLLLGHVGREGVRPHRLQVQHVLVDILRVARAAEILEELFEHRDPVMAVGDDGAGH